MTQDRWCAMLLTQVDTIYAVRLDAILDLFFCQKMYFIATLIGDPLYNFQPGVFLDRGAHGRSITTSQSPLHLCYFFHFLPKNDILYLSTGAISYTFAFHDTPAYFFTPTQHYKKCKTDDFVTKWCTSTTVSPRTGVYNFGITFRQYMKESKKYQLYGNCML